MVLPKATIVYYASDMILEVFGDASYNSERDAHSRGGGFFHCARTNDPSFINGPVLCVSTLIPTVVASAAEAEYATLFINGKLAISLRRTLTDMNCLQGPTKMITDNATAKKSRTVLAHSNDPSLWICVTTGFDNVVKNLETSISFGMPAVVLLSPLLISSPNLTMQHCGYASLLRSRLWTLCIRFATLPSYSCLRGCIEY